MEPNYDFSDLCIYANKIKEKDHIVTFGVIRAVSISYKDNGANPEDKDCITCKHYCGIDAIKAPCIECNEYQNWEAKDENNDRNQ